MFCIISSVTGANVEDLSAAAQLDTLGVDSLMSLEIACCLREMLHIDIGTDYFLGSKSIGDLLAKLRYVTRPTYGLLRNAASGSKGQLSNSVLRFRVANARFCLLEVGSKFSFMERVDNIWHRLTFTESRTAKFDIPTPVSGMALSLDATEDPVKLTFRIGTEPRATGCVETAVTDET